MGTGKESRRSCRTAEGDSGPQKEMATHRLCLALGAHVAEGRGQVTHSRSREHPGPPPCSGRAAGPGLCSETPQ